MADVHSAATRSRNMRAIRSGNTKPELLLRKILHHAGFRYRLHSGQLPGKPDLVLKKYKVVIFVHGCFWHKHDCHLFRLPKTRQCWWKTKLTENRMRDLANEDKLRERGWRVAVVWECALKGKARLEPAELLAHIKEWIESGNDSYLEVPEPSLSS